MTDLLFPLPLAPFEQYMFEDERPGYSMTPIIEVHVRGKIDRRAFEAAVTRAVQRHPLLRASIEQPRFGSPRWVPNHQTELAVTWFERGAAVDLEELSVIDITRDAGLRFVVLQGDEEHRIVILIHHACADGIGIFRFFGDVLACYAMELDPDKSITLPERDPGLLPTRGRSRWGVLPRQIGWAEAWRGRIRETAKWMTRHPTPLATPRPTSVERRAALTRLRYFTFDPQATRALRVRAQENSSTLNDQLIRDLFVALERWNQRHANKRPGKWLQVNMPTNLRLRDDRAMPAANVLGYTFLTRCMQECRDPDKLLEAISRDTRAIKSWRLGNLFLEGLTSSQKVPRSIRSLWKRPTCFATTVLTNVGNPARIFDVRLPRVAERTVVGDLTLLRFVIAPPVRPLTRATFAITNYAGALTITVRSDSQLFSPDDEQALLDLYVETIGELSGDHLCSPAIGGPQTD